MPKDEKSKTPVFHPDSEITKAAIEKANYINEISMDYHLSHATFACNIELENKRKAIVERANDEINRKIKSSVEKNKPFELKKLIKEKSETLNAIKKLRIYIEFLEKSKETAYTVLDKDENQLVICIPRQLLKESMQDGVYTNKVKVLRRLVAHELGHAVMHTEKLLGKGGYGSKGFKDNTQEEYEAQVFADHLLKLRHDRNKKMRDNGTAELYF